MADEHERGVGQAHAAPGLLQQRHARLALEHRELLGDGRGREPQRVGHRGDRAARVQLAQQPQAAKIEHRKRRYRISVRNRHRSYVLGAHDAPHARAGALLCLASAAAFGAMGVFGKLAYDEGATVGTLLASAS